MRTSSKMSVKDIKKSEKLAKSEERRRKNYEKSLEKNLKMPDIDWRITKRKGGTVSRKSGGKIMQGYKAGGRV
jgi:hypothetical protein